VAQILKGVVHAASGRMRKARELAAIVAWRTGGMPSSHAAAVCSLCVAIAFAEGISSNMFALSLWLALIVLRDAVGVRRSAGLSARALNTLGRAASEKLGIDFQPAKEVQGHTPLEVIVGALLGGFIAAGLSLL